MRRHKYIVISLGIYWMLIFVLTHMPVPDIARQSGMSDKTMHVMAYFILTFLIWCAVSPYQRIEWNKPKIWGIVAVIVWYGAIDEYLQGFVGRSVELHDFIANLFGMIFALGVLSIFHFWSALLTISAVSVFVISNLSKLTSLYPEYHVNTLFYFAAYAGLALVWIQHMERYLPLRHNRAAWLLTAAALPLAMLGVISGTAPLFGKTVWWVDAATAVFGITAAILTSWLTFLVTQRQVK